MRGWVARGMRQKQNARIIREGGQETIDAWRPGEGKADVVGTPTTGQALCEEAVQCVRRPGCGTYSCTLIQIQS